MGSSRCWSEAGLPSARPHASGGVSAVLCMLGEGRRGGAGGRNREWRGQQDRAPGCHRHPTLFPPGRAPRGGEDGGSEEALRPSALRVVRNQVDPSELEGRILGLGRGCPTDEEGNTRGPRPPTHERGARQPVPRSSLRPLAGNLPSSPSQVLTARRSGLSALSAVLRAHGSGARSRSGPQPLAPAALPDQGRRRLRARARAPRQPHANFPAAATLGGGGGGGRGRGQQRPAGGAAAEGPRLPLRAPARASALLPRPRRATRRPGALPDRPLPARRCRHLPRALLSCGTLPEDTAPQTSPPRAHWGDPRPGNPGRPIAAPSRERSGGRTGVMRGRRATRDGGYCPLPLPLPSSGFWAFAASFPGADCGED